MIGSPGYAASDEEVTAFVARGVDYAPYDPDGMGRHMAAVIAAAPRNERLKSVTAPTLVIHGEADPLIPLSGGQDTAESIPGRSCSSFPARRTTSSNRSSRFMSKAIGDFAAKVEAGG